MINNFRYWFSKHGFDVCSRLADWLGIKVKNVRLVFIYVSFTTLIGGFLVYLILAFWIKIKDMVYKERSSVFDL
tara:strand:- start:1163 stop:1384 length:222 start_codon:yes stop_codon:yes gene_type:complete